MKPSDVSGFARRISIERVRCAGASKLAALFALLASLAASRVRANTYTVTNTNDSGAGSLRQAILDANANAGLDTIHFAIAGSGVQTIVVASAFPKITSPVIIDGFSQTGSAANTHGPGLADNSVHLIEIDGTACPGPFVAALFDFDLGSGGSTVRGLVINRCSRSAIRLGNTVGANHVEGNFLGTDPSGTVAEGNGAAIDVEDFGSGEKNDVIGGTTADTRNVISGNGTGITFGSGGGGGSGHHVQGNFIGTDSTGTAALPNSRGVSIPYNTGVVFVGGTTPAERNIISGNSADGVFIGGGFPSGVNGVVVEGNYIGTDLTGTTALPNAGNGVTNNQGANTIGGSADGAGNVIAGNAGAGIALGNGTTVQGNRIGVSAGGDPLGNKSSGIVIYGSGATIGGTAAGEGNVIAYNGAMVGNGAGVRIDGGGRVNVAIRGNSIHSNTSSGSPANRGLGIDLNSDGPTPNDAGDTDGGDNNSQNYPVLTRVTPGGGSTTIEGKLNSTASTDFALDFFANTTCDPTGFGEGETYLGSKTVTTDSGGNASFSVTFPVTATSVTATATDPNDNTSEFSRCAAAVPAALAVDPAAGATSDGDGVFEPGETVEVQPSWLNPTALSLSMSGTASALAGPSGPGYATVDAAATYAVAADATGSCTATPDCYEMSVSLSGPRPAAHWDASFTETLDNPTSPKLWKLHLGDSFTDVPRSQLFYRKIETVFHNAITVGCTPTTYCPADQVPRDQMAIFLARGIAHGGANVPSSGVVGSQPYNCSGGGVSLYSDVAPTAISCKSIHYIAAQNVTTGCSPGKYCPSDSVSRSQMAIFVAKSIVAPAGGPGVPLSYTDPNTHISYSCDPASPKSSFTDVTVSDTFCKHVNFLFAKGIIAGCGGSLYCPGNGVTRGEMAKFLSNAFGLLLYGP